MTRYLNAREILDIAEGTLGARPGVRDWGLLESAAARPQASVFGEGAYGSTFEKAAALMHSIASNHALVDGNKRTGWAAAVVFLGLNGHMLAEGLDEDESEKLVLSMAQSQMDIPEAAERLKGFME